MSNIETTRDTLKAASIDLLKAVGWKPGDKFSFHSVSELMVALAIKVAKGEIGCDYPSCGCCADAACADAVKQHPDIGGTPPKTSVRPLEWSPYPDDGSTTYEGQNQQRRYVCRAVLPWPGAIFIMEKDGRFSLEKFPLMSFDNEAGAKTAAQSIFDAWIRAALTPAKEGQ